MTFLQLVQRAHVESGRQGAAPTTVIGQTGMNQRFVNWVLTAYEFIQGMHETWLFRQKEFSFPTVNAKQNYAPVADLAYTDLGAWKFNPDNNNLSGIKLYSSVADEQHLECFAWDDYRDTYKLGSNRTQSGRPTIFTIKPDMSMDLWPIPDAIYTVSGEYVRDLQTMAADGDVPILPDHHMLIVWKALEYYGAYEGAGDVYAHGQNEFDILIPKLELNQLQKICWGSPLA
jgi:hypothetical protein